MTYNHVHWSNNHTPFDCNVMDGLGCPVSQHYYLKAKGVAAPLEAERFAYKVRAIAAFLSAFLPVANKPFDADDAVMNDLFQFMLKRLWFLHFGNSHEALT